MPNMTNGTGGSRDVEKMRGCEANAERGDRETWRKWEDARQMRKNGDDATKMEKKGNGGFQGYAEKRLPSAAKRLDFYQGYARG